MRQVIHRGTPQLNDPDRLAPTEDAVTAVGVDETAYLRATATHATTFRDRDRRPEPGPPSAAARRGRGPLGHRAGRLANRAGGGLAGGITTASLDPFRGYATALSSQLPDAVRVLDPIHVVRLALACVDDVRRRVQQAQTGHRGRTDDPLYGIRRVLRRRIDHLSVKARARLEAGLIAGDPDGEVTLAWITAQDVMALYQQDDPDRARTHATELIAALREFPIAELARLGRTLPFGPTWRQFLSAQARGILAVDSAHLDTPSCAASPTSS